MNKLAVTLWSYKGGVGKSTISLILAQIAAQNKLKVLAIDLDEQRNLTKMLKLSETEFPTIELRTDLKDEYAEEDFDLYVIDTHPTKDKKVIDALGFSDIVLIPILGDYQSIVNLPDVFNYVYQAGVGREQAAIVKNCMSDLKVNVEIGEAIDEQGYPVAGTLPRCNSLLSNIASGYKWDKYIRRKQRANFIVLNDNLWCACAQMQNGNFSNLWDKKLGDK